jgi:hypothetical protein
MYEIISFVLGVLGILSLVVYLIHWKFYSPHLLFRVAGEQRGEPIKVNPIGQVPFATFTKSSKKIRVLGLWIYFNPDDVDLFKTRGAKKEMTVDRQFPMSISFGEEKDVVKGTLQANYFKYQAKGNKFIVKFDGLSEINSTELPFLLDMFSPRKVRSTRTVTFEVDKNVVMDLKTHGLLLLPGEAMQTVGVQSQEGVWAVGDKEGTVIEVMELVEDDKDIFDQ